MAAPWYRRASSSGILEGLQIEVADGVDQVCQAQAGSQGPWAWPIGPCGSFTLVAQGAWGPWAVEPIGPWRLGPLGTGGPWAPHI